MKIDELFERLRPVGISKEDIKSGSRYEVLLEKIESKLDKVVQSSISEDEDLYPLFEEQRQAFESVSLSLKELLSRKDEESGERLKKSLIEETKITKATRKVLEDRPDEDKLKFTDSFEASLTLKSHSNEIEELIENIKSYKSITKRNREEAKNLSDVLKSITDDFSKEGKLGTVATALAPLEKVSMKDNNLEEAVEVAKEAVEKDEELSFLPKEIRTSLKDIYSLLESKLSNLSEDNSYLNRIAGIKEETESSNEDNSGLIEKLKSVLNGIEDNSVEFMDLDEKSISLADTDSIERVNANSEEYLSDLKEDQSYKEDISKIREDVSKILDLMGGTESVREKDEDNDSEGEKEKKGSSGFSLGSMFGLNKLSAGFGTLTKAITGFGALLSKAGLVAEAAAITWKVVDGVLTPMLEESREKEEKEKEKLQTLQDLRKKDFEELSDSEKKVYENYLKKVNKEIYDNENPTEKDRWEHEESIVDSHELKTTPREEWLKRMDTTADKAHARALNMARYGTEKPTEEQVKRYNSSYNLAQSLGVSRDEAEHIYDYIQEPTDEKFKNLTENERSNLAKAQIPNVGNIDVDKNKVRKDAEYAFKAVGIGGQNTYAFSNKDYGRLSGELGEKYGGELTVNGVTVDWGALANSIAATETGGRYDLQNSAGHNYFGKYQLGIQELQSLGFLSDDDSWKKMSKLDRTDWIKGDVWKGDKAKEFGISSLDDFYNSPEAQEWAARSYTEKNMKALSSLKINAFGKQLPLFEAAKRLNYTPEQIVKAAQFGVGNLQAVLQAEQEINEKKDVQDNMDFLAGKRRKEVNGRLYSAIDGTGVSIKNYLNDASARNIALQREGALEYSNRLNYQGELTNEVNLFSLENKAKEDKPVDNRISAGSFVNGKWDDSGDYSKLESGDFISFKDNLTVPKMLGFVGVNKMPDGTYQSIMVDPKTKGPALPDKDGKFPSDAVSVSVNSPMYSEILRVNLAKQEFRNLPEDFEDGYVKDLNGDNLALTRRQQLEHYNTMIAAAKNSSKMTYGAAMIKARGDLSKVNGAPILSGNGDMMGIYNPEPDFDLSKLKFGETSNALPALEMEYTAQNWNVDTRSLNGGNVVKAEVLDDLRGRAIRNSDGTAGVVSEYEGEPHLDIRSDLSKKIASKTKEVTSKLSDWTSFMRKKAVATTEPDFHSMIDTKVKEIENGLETATMKKVQEVSSLKPVLPALNISEKKEQKKEKEVVQKPQQQSSNVVTTVITYQTIDSLTRDDIGNIGTA